MLTARIHLNILPLECEQLAHATARGMGRDDECSQIWRGRGDETVLFAWL